MKGSEGRVGLISGVGKKKNDVATFAKNSHPGSRVPSAQARQ